MTWSVSAFIKEKLVTAKGAEDGFTVTSVFCAVRRAESLLSSLTRYVPIAVAFTLVDARFGVRISSELGPRTRDQRVFNTPIGSPSSDTVPCKVIGFPNRYVCGRGAATTGALLVVVGSYTRIVLTTSA